MGETAKNNTLIFYAKKFHWAWFVPIDKDIVSVGMVTRRADFLKTKQTSDENYRSELFSINPDLPELGKSERFGEKSAKRPKAAPSPDLEGPSNLNFASISVARFGCAFVRAPRDN